MRRLGVTLVLVVVFSIMIGAVDLASWSLAVVVSATIARLVAPTGSPPRALLRRLVSWPRFLLGAAGQVAAGTATMARVLLGRRSGRNCGYVRVRTEARTRRGSDTMALVVSASPGSVLVETSADGAELVLHVIDARDPDAIQASINRFYHQYQEPAVP